MCSSVFPSEANFCALCGSPLVTICGSPVARNFGLGLFIIVAALITYVVFAATRSAPVMEDRCFELPSTKSAALFELLKPRDIKVLVRKDAGCVQITGTPKESDVLTAFVKLITRYSGAPAHEVQRRMSQARRDWTTRRTYKLSKAKAKTLFNILAPDDVPVLVSWSGKRLRVDASPKDQEIIRHVVEILRGRRL